IYAPTDYQCAYGLAWATAEDHFDVICQQLLTSRHIRGKWSGKDGATVDYYGRWIRARERVERDWERISPEYKQIMFAYAAAINVFEAEHGVPIKAARECFPVHPKDLLTNVVVTLSGMVGLPEALKSAMDGQADAFIFPPRFGSNEWVFSGDITESGKPTLVINPHVNFTGEHHFYEASVHSDEGWEFWGALFPGMPTPALGCSRDMGYAITFNWPDYVDIYKLKINPENNNQYWMDGRWWDFERDKAKLKVRLGLFHLPVKRELLWSAHGPAMRTDHGVFAFRYAAKDPVLAGEQWYKMSKSKNLEEFKQAMAMQAIPLFNLAYADKDNNIYYVFSGNLPERPEGPDWQRTLPGDDSSLLWDEYVPFARMPQLENPECGYLINTNSTPFRATCSGENIDSTQYSRKYGIFWNQANNRHLRSEQLIEAKAGEKWSLEDIKALKFDHTWPQNGTMVQVSLENYRRLDPQKYPDLAEEIKLLQSWNGVGDTNNIPATISLLTMQNLGNMHHISYGRLEDGHTAKEQDVITALRMAKKQLEKQFGTVKVPLGKIQMLCRGKGNCLPVNGLPEALRSVYPVGSEAGKLIGSVGDTYTAFAEFGEDGLSSLETIVPYGTSGHEDSPHYADQMPLYTREQTKTITLERDELLQKAERIYHPR
ncbi:MAG: penicillin acylase family protein, partial [Bacteroidota bacterium]